MTDPVVEMANRDATDEMEGIHTHYNDDIKFEVDSPSLVGRTDEGRGPPQKIAVVSPLMLADRQLSLDLVMAAPLKLEEGQLFIDLALIGDFPGDAAAAAGGVPIGGIYRTGSDLRIRTT
jgi:hypothetical protein